MGITIRRVRPEWYLPRYGGNREKAQADPTYAPFEVELRLPTWVEWRKHLEALAAAPDHQRLALQRGYLGEHIGEIRGLTLEDGTAITSGLQLIGLADRIDAEIVEELNRALAKQESLDEGLRGNFPGPPTSGGWTQGNDGIAGNVALRVGTS